MVRISETAARRAKMSSIWTLCGRKRAYVQLLEFLFKYENFENWPVSLKLLPMEGENELNFKPLG